MKEKIVKFRKLLERNKIFFETVVMVALTFMSIIVAWNSNKIADEANKLAEKEAAIEHSEKLPRFTMDSQEDLLTCNILNVGGNVSNATASFGYYVCIDISSDQKEETIVVRVIDAYEHYNVDYDYEKHTFTNKANELIIYTMMEELIEIMSEFGINVKYEIIDIAEIFYRDYTGEPHVERYSIDTTAKSYLSILSDETYYDFMENYEFPIFGSVGKTDEVISSSLSEIVNVILDRFEL